MPTVVKTQPTGAFSQGVKSIGAVIFDKPQYDPLTIQMKVADDLDAWGAKKAKAAEEKKAKLFELTKDLYTPNTKGILTEHSPLIKDAAKNTIDAQANYFSELSKSGGEPTQSVIEAQRKFQQAKNDTELIISQSQEGFKRIDELMKDPEKLKDTDLEELQKKVIAVRMGMPNTKEYESALQNFQITPKKKSLYDLVQEKGKAIGETVTSEVGTKGGIITEQKKTTKFTPDQLAIENLPTQLYMDRDVKERTDDLFSRYNTAAQKPLTQMNPQEKADYVAFKKYIDESAADGGKYDPRIYAVQDYLKMQNYIKEDVQSKGETEASKVGSSIGIKNKKNAEGFIKFLAQVQYGDQDVYQTTVDPNTLGGWNGEFYGTKAFGNLSYGKRPMKYTDPETQKEMEVAVPNLVRYFWKDPQTGILRIATDETVQNYKDKKATAPFIQIDDVSQIVPTLGGEFVGDDVSGFMTGYTDAIRDNKWGSGKNTVKFDPLKVNPGMKRPTETPKTFEKEVPSVQFTAEGKRVEKPATSKTGKVDYSKYPQSSDGKWYFDGKEWKAIK